MQGNTIVLFILGMMAMFYMWFAFHIEPERAVDMEGCVDIKGQMYCNLKSI